jgi:hypothetical protein
LVAAVVVEEIPGVSGTVMGAFEVGMARNLGIKTVVKLVDLVV